MLTALQGKKHEVWTGAALVGPGAGKIRIHCERTEVHFRRLSRKALLDYVRTQEPYDKAGGYDIQGTAADWVEKWKGDYFNVMGLPAKWLVRALGRFSRQLSR